MDPPKPMKSPSGCTNYRPFAGWSVPPVRELRVCIDREYVEAAIVNDGKVSAEHSCGYAWGVGYVRRRQPAIHDDLTLLCQLYNLVGLHS